MPADSTGAQGLVAATRDLSAQEHLQTLVASGPGADDGVLPADTTRRPSPRLDAAISTVSQPSADTVCGGQVVCPAASSSEAYSGVQGPQSRAQEGSMPPYALDYIERFGKLPWDTDVIVPWLSLLPPEAYGSLYEWGRLLFSQTPACKRGSVSMDMYYMWEVGQTATNRHTTAADVLITSCAAFAHSPLSLVIDMQAALQCINLAVRHALGSRAVAAPYWVAEQLDHVCAAGCGKDLSQGHTHIPQYGETLKYCSEECAHKHVARLPEAARIYMCCSRTRSRDPTTATNGKALQGPRRETILFVQAYLQKNPTSEEEARTYVERVIRACKQVEEGEGSAQARARKMPPREAYTRLLAWICDNDERLTSLEHVLPESHLDAMTNVLRCRAKSSTALQRGSDITRQTPTHEPTPDVPAQTTVVGQSTRKKKTKGKQAKAAAQQPEPHPLPLLPAPSHPTPVPHTTPATTHAPHSPCTTAQRLTEADLARLSDLARDARADASRDARPMLWHVRRRVYERMCARMGLPAAGVQSLLWVASERGDAWGGLWALCDADPAGLCLPPELRIPLAVWDMVSILAGHVFCYAFADEAWHWLVCKFLRGDSNFGYRDLCARCGKQCEDPESLFVCQGCDVVSLCSEECGTQHKSSGICEVLAACWGAGNTWEDRDRAVLPLSFFSLPARTASTASDQQAPHTSNPTPLPTSPLQSDASATAGCPAAAAVPAPSRGVSAQRTHKHVSAAKALAAEYRQCVEGNALLRRVAEVVMPRGAEREPESAAVMAAQQLLIAASGLLDARDLEEVLAAAGA